MPGYRRYALFIAIVFGLTVVVPPGWSPLEGPNEFPLAGVWRALTTRPAWAMDRPTTPSQAHGSGVNLAAEATRANGGSGRAPGKVGGANEPYESPRPADRPEWTTPAETVGYVAGSSQWVAADSTKWTDVYRNADGSVTQRVHQHPVNYKGSDGIVRPIDTQLVQMHDGRWQVRSGEVGVSLAGFRGKIPATEEGLAAASLPGDGVQELVTITLPGGQVVSYSMNGARQVEPSVSGSTATYGDIMPQTDVEVVARADGAKGTVIVKSRSAGNSWIFPLRLEGVSARLEADGSVALLDRSGAKVATIPAGTMQDSQMQPDGERTTSNRVSFELVDGGTALKVTADRAWLDDPARVYPVRIDPTATLWDDSGDVYVDQNGNGVVNGDSLGIGCYDPDGAGSAGCNKRRSFLSFNNFGGYSWGAPNQSLIGRRITDASLSLFHTWSESCGATRSVWAYPVTQWWSPSNMPTTSYPGPSVGNKIGDLYISDNSPACTNTSGNRSVGDWRHMNITDVSVFNAWSVNPGTNYGLALSSDNDLDREGWKRFTSRDYGNGDYAPYITFTWENNDPPQVEAQYPTNGYASPTLTPELMVYATDPDATNTLTYKFWVYDGVGNEIVNSGATNIATRNWTVPEGKLKWGQVYWWTAGAWDGLKFSTSQQTIALSTQIPQPPITSALAQNPGGYGFEPSVGNFTNETVDVQVPVAGPPLVLKRSYNSRDPRTGLAFGSGWSTVLDSKVTESVQKDSAGKPLWVTVRYPSGPEMAFGRQPDGTFASPSGDFANFKPALVGTGYELIDKQGTTFAFTRDLTGGSYALASVTDNLGRATTLSFNAGNQVTSMKSEASARSLTFGWTGGHVTTVTTDRTNPNDPASVITWKYSYSGDKLEKACPPTDTDATKCTVYSYGSGTLYPTAVLNAVPHTYLPLDDPTGSTTAASSAANSLNPGVGVYSNVTLGVSDPRPNNSAVSAAKVASFNGTSSLLQLPSKRVEFSASYQSISLWFKTASRNGVLLSYQRDAVSPGATTTGNYTPALYVDSNGKLRGQFWDGSIAPMSSAKVVDDNQWHHVVLVAGGSQQWMYLDDEPARTKTGDIRLYAVSDINHQYVGAGFIGGSWPDQPNTGAGTASFFNGKISDFAFFAKPLTGAQAVGMHALGVTRATPLTQITRPSTNVQAKVQYNSAGAVTQVTDANGGVWDIAKPTFAGSGEAYAAAVLADAPADYFRMKETGVTSAVNEVNGNSATYNSVTLGATDGPVGDTTASFNGTTSYVSLPPQDIATNNPASVSLWFKANLGTSGVLYSTSQQPVGPPSDAAPNWNPVLYIGADGLLRGQLWTNAANPITSTVPVNDGNWHHVALSSSGTAQTLYLDGAKVAALAGTVSVVGFDRAYLGAGKWTSWPSGGTGVSYFSGKISDFAYFRSELTDKAVAAQFRAREGRSLESNSVYKERLLAASPLDYFRLADAAGTAPVNEVSGGVAASYSNVVRGSADSPFSDTTSALFNGTSSYVSLPTRDMTVTGPASLSMWFKAPQGKFGVLYSYMNGALGENGYVPALYIGEDGKLRGTFWTGSSSSTIATSAIVNDGNWHHVVLAATTNSQSLYLDGAKAGSLAGNVTGFGATHAYLGMGKWTGWPGTPQTGEIGYFAGLISDFAFFSGTMSDSLVSHLAGSRYKSQGTLLKKIQVTDPGNHEGRNVTTNVYDVVAGGRLVEKIAPLGRRTVFGYDARGFHRTTTDPLKNVTINEHDDRGNIKATTTCQDLSENDCSTTFYEYYLAPGTPPAEDPRNDLMIEMRDARGTLTDNTYLTTYTYDAKGNLVDTTDPLQRKTKRELTTGTVVPHDLAGLSGTGRYVRINGTLSGTTGYSLYDLQVYGPSGGNLAVGRPATASSTSGSLVAANAVDGDALTRWASNSTNSEWIQVDLGSPQAIGRVRLYWDGAYGKAYQVQTSNDGSTWTTIKEETQGSSKSVPAGLLRKSTTPGGAVVTLEYNEFGDLVSKVDAVGLRTLYAYDGVGRLANQKVITDSPSGDLITTVEYDQLGRVWRVTDPKVTNRVTGAVHTKRTTSTYDHDGQLTKMVMEDLTGGDASREVEMHYNAFGKKDWQTDSKYAGQVGNKSSFLYDGFGRVTRQTQPDGRTVSLEYDAVGNQVKTNLLGWTGDPNYPVAADDLPLEERSYDAAGRLASITDAMRWQTLYTYTDNDLLATVTRKDPNTGTTYEVQSSSYDDAGNMTSQLTENRTLTTQFAVDAASRTVSRTADPKDPQLNPNGLNRTISYTLSADDTVLTTKISNGTEGQESFIDATYDLGGRKTSEAVRNAGGGEPDSWWRLDETVGSVARDSAAARRDANLYYGVSWADRGAAFDGSGDIAYSAAPVLNTTLSFTISTWAKVPAGGGGVIVAQDGAWRSGFELTSGANWGANKPCGDGNYGAIWLDSGTPVVVDKWTHVAIVFDTAAGNVMRLFVDGVEKASGTNCGAGFQANGAFTIGRGKYNNTAAGRFKGGIDNVQVYRRAASASDIAALHGKGRDGATLGSTGTSWAIDKRGLVTAVTDANGNTTHFDNDEAGRRVVTSSPTMVTEQNGIVAPSAESVMKVGYDTFGGVVEAEQPYDRETKYRLDANGQILETELPSYTPPGSAESITSITKTFYDSVGQVTKQTNALGKDTLFYYDQLGRVSSVKTADLQVTKFGYTKNGEKTYVQDPLGARVEATYDYMGRRITATQVMRSPAVSHVTNYAYDTAGFLRTVTPDGRAATTYTYNKIGETTTVTDAAGNSTNYTHDYAGRPTLVTLPDSSKQKTFYDHAGRPTAQQRLSPADIVLASTSATYDGVGNVLTATDAMNATTQFTYGPTNLLTSMTQPISATDSITTSFGYDALGNQTRFTDGRNNKFLTTYNDWNLPESEIEPDGSAFTTVYDPAGQPKELRSPGGVTATYAYDDMGRILSAAGSGAEAATVARTYTYDEVGRVKTLSGSGGVNTMSYDDRGQLTSTSGPSGTSSFTYTPDGLMASRQDSAGTTSYTYDTAGRLDNAANPAAGIDLTYEYNALSQVKKIIHGGSGNNRILGYDSLAMLATDDLQTPGGQSIAKLTYGWDKNGNLTSKVATGFSGGGSNSYTYDKANRLTSWNNGSTVTNYSYDKSGNRTQAGAKTFSYNNRNQLTSDSSGTTYQHAPRGTLRSTTTGTVVLDTLSDAFDQVVKQYSAPSQFSQYEYDGLGRVIQTGFSYTGLGNDLAADPAATYIRGPSGGLLGSKVGSNGVYNWTDLHTDVVAQFTATGTTLSGSTTYEPYGKVVSSSAMQGNLGYQSGWTDNQTKRVNMLARWYNPETGQFDSRDSASVSPVPSSIRANRYSYASASPLVRTDPTGHWDTEGLGDGFSGMGIPVSEKAAFNLYAQKQKKHRQQAAAKAEADRAYLAARQAACSGGQGSWGAGAGEGNEGCFVAEKCVERTSADRSLKMIFDDPVMKSVFSNCTTLVVYPDGTVVINGVIKTTRGDLGDIDPKLVAKQIDELAGSYGGYNDAAGDRALITSTVIGDAVVAASGKQAEIEQRKKEVKCQEDFWCRNSAAITIGLTVLAVIATVATGGLAGILIGIAAAVVINVASDFMQGNINSWGDLALSAAVGLAEGVVGAVTGGAGGALAGKLIGKMAAKAIGKMFVGAVSGAAGSAGVSYAMTGEVSMNSVLMGAALGAAGGAAAGRGGKFGKGCGSDVASGLLGAGIGAVAHSFDPETKVLMADGSAKPIKDVEIGDKVAATDPQTGTTTAEPVVLLHINRDLDLTDVTVSSTPAATVEGRQQAEGSGTTRGPTATLHTTQHHPFWDVATSQWTDAAKLKPGESTLTGPDGQLQYVVAIRKYSGTKEMRDLTVDNIHTYYVVAGDTPVLVHNCGGSVPGHPDTCACAGTVEPGQTVYRVWGAGGVGGAGPWGRYWSREDPRITGNYRDEAGLPDANPARFLSIGTLRGTKGVEVTPGGAAPLDGNIGGIDEIKVPWPRLQIRVHQVIGLNPEL